MASLILMHPLSFTGSEGGRESRAVGAWEKFSVSGMAYLSQELRHLLSTRAKPYEWCLPTAYLPKPDQCEALARIFPMSAAEAEVREWKRLLQVEQGCATTTTTTTTTATTITTATVEVVYEARACHLTG